MTIAGGHNEPGSFLWQHQRRRPQTRRGAAPELAEDRFPATLDEAKLRLQQLLQLCRRQVVSCSLEYEEVDKEGNPVSDEFTVH
jgi:hypothetical protein